jgi:hypothetical protein
MKQSDYDNPELGLEFDPNSYVYNGELALDEATSLSLLINNRTFVSSVIGLER